MTITEVAKELGVSNWVLSRLCHRGQFPAIKRRKSWFIPKNYRHRMSKKLLTTFEGIPNKAFERSEHPRPARRRKPIKLYTTNLVSKAGASWQVLKWEDGDWRQVGPWHETEKEAEAAVAELEKK